MSPVQRGRRRSSKSRGFLACWWPLLLALAATPFAVRAASLLALSGPLALKALFPFVTFMQTHWTASLAHGQREELAQWAMWAQFPFYGLLASLIGCATRMVRGIGIVLLLHGAAVAVALLLTR